MTDMAIGDRDPSLIYSDALGWHRAVASDLPPMTDQPQVEGSGEAERLVERLRKIVRATPLPVPADNRECFTHEDSILWKAAAFTTEQARQLAEMRERRLPESETDDDPPKSGFNCACLFDDQTAEPVQVCIGHGRVSEELADFREQRKELLDAKYTLLPRITAAEADRAKLAIQYDALLLERTLERERMDRLESENVAMREALDSAASLLEVIAEDAQLANDTATWSMASVMAEKSRAAALRSRSGEDNG